MRKAEPGCPLELHQLKRHSTFQEFQIGKQSATLFCFQNPPFEYQPSVICKHKQDLINGPHIEKFIKLHKNFKNALFTPTTS